MNSLENPISFVYVLCNCKTNEPFYVGTTISFKNRMKNHLNCRRSKNKGSLIAGKLNRSGRGVISLIAYIGPRKSALALERSFIKQFRDAGIKLGNQKTGAVAKRK